MRCLVSDAFHRPSDPNLTELLFEPHFIPETDVWRGRDEKNSAHAREELATRQDRCVSSSSQPDGAEPASDDRRAKAREGPERRRKPRPELSDEMEAAARVRARGTCECSNENCWHFHRCKAPAVAYVGKRSATGVVSCVMYCRECARTAGGQEGRL